MSSNFSIANHGSGPQSVATGGPQNNNIGGGTQYNVFFPDSGEDQAKETERLRAEREACLRSLAFRGLNARQYDIEPPYPNTCNWLFNTAEFRKWRDGTELRTHNGVIWIKGKPGAGKSTLMKHTLQHCKKNFGNHLIVAYFFNAQGESLEKSPHGMLQSIVYQLLEQNAALYEQFVPIFHEQKRIHNGLDWQWRLPQLKEFIRLVIGQRQSGPVLLLIDALDECNEDDVRDVVNFLESLSIIAVQAGIELRICLSSRHYPNVNMKKNLKLTVETSKEHKQDIARYLSQTLTKRDYDIEAGIRQKANGIFMWVVLVVSLLNKAYDEGQVEAMQKTLEEVPDDLDGLFDAILDKYHSNRTEKDKAETILMFQWVLLSRRPLKPEEIFAAVVGTPLPTIGDIERRITASSKGLIEVQRDMNSEAYVQFIHLSVADFLCRNRRLQTLDSTLQPDPISASHGILWARCWSYIEHLDTTQNMRSLIRSHRFLRYAMKHIFDHAEKALPGRKANDFSGKLEILIHPHDTSRQEAILEWLRKQNDWFRWWKTFHITNRDYGYPDQDSDDGAGLLYVISVRGHLNMTRLLLQNGADINAQGGFYGNALQAAVCKGDQTIAELLLEKGADTNAQGGLHGNVLQAAIYKGNRKLVELLLEKGADINAQGGLYGNALRAAVGKGDLTIVELLLEKGADTNVRSQFCGNALQVAVGIGDRAIVELLLGKGVDINAQGEFCDNVLQVAVDKGDQAIIELLLEKGIDINAQGGLHGSALQAAVYKGNRKLVELFLDKGAEINAQGGLYGNALQAAVYKKDRIVVELLLEKGADINAQGELYGNALQIAVNGGDQAIVKLLLENGADSNALQAAVKGGNQTISPMHPQKWADNNTWGGTEGLERPVKRSRG